jgi:hypothetical protein
VDSTTFQLPNVTLGVASDAQLCRDEVFAFIDNVQGQLANLCCARPAVVLGKVMLTRAPGSLANGLPGVPQYLVIADAYPCRKPTFQVGWFTKTWPNFICTQTTAGSALPANTVIQTTGDHVRQQQTVSPPNTDFVYLFRDANNRVKATLARPRLVSSSLKVSFSASYVLQNVTAVSFRILLDGAAVVAGVLPLLQTSVDPTISTVQMTDVIPASVLGEPRAHTIEVQISLTAVETPAGSDTPLVPSLVVDPTKYDGASVVIQELAG